MQVRLMYQEATTSGNGATRVNKDGFIEQVPDNVPRLDYSDGGCPKLLTEATSNIDGSIKMKTWVQQGISIEPYEDLMGGQDAVKITSLGNGLTTLYNNIGGINTTRVFSFFCKKGNTRYVAFRDQFSGYFNVVVDLDSVNFSLESGSGYQGGLVSKFNEEWFRIEVIATIGTGNTFVSISPHENINAPSGNYCYVWGYQQESNTALKASSYVPTNGSAIIRNTDDVFGAGDSLMFNSSSGVLFTDVKGASDSFSGVISLSNQTTNFGARLIFQSSQLQNEHIVNGVAQFYSATSLDITLQNKTAQRYSDGNFSSWVNGINVNTSLTGSTSGAGSLTKIAFNIGNGGFSYSGKTKSIQHFDYLTDEEMEKLTGYDSYDQMISQFNFTTL